MKPLHPSSMTTEELIEHVTNSHTPTAMEVELALRLVNIQSDLLKLKNELDSFKSATYDFMIENNIPFAESERIIQQLSQPEADDAGILTRPKIKVE